MTDSSEDTQQTSVSEKELNDRTMFSQHDTPPPLVVGEGSLTVEAAHDFTQVTGSGGRKFRKGPRPGVGAVEIHHLKIVHGNGDVLYQIHGATGCKTEIWVNEPPSGNYHLRLLEESTAFQIEGSHPLNHTPNAHPNHKRKNKIEHPGIGSANFRITRIRVHRTESGVDRTLFDVTVPTSSTASQEYRIMVWLDGVEPV